MHLKSVLAKLSFLVAVLIVGVVLCPFAAGQQPKPWAGSISDPSQFAKTQSLADTLNDEAAAPDSAGIHRYSEHLVKLLVPDRAGKKYIRSLTDRLARAEEQVRKGQGDLVPEEKVTEAFNDLMKKVGAPTSLLTNGIAVRNLRLMPFDKSTDALTTMSRNGANCNPGVAMYLLLVLIWNNGGPRAPLVRIPEDAQRNVSTSDRWISFEVISPANPSAGRSLGSYFAAHRPSETTALFNAMARTFGF